MEVPSSDSERSSSRTKNLNNNYAKPAFSGRSYDSYGFQPRENAIVHRTNNEALVTGAALMMMTTEGDDNIVKSTGAEAIVEDYDNDGKDMMR